MSITIPMVSKGGGQGQVIAPNPTIVPAGPPTVLSVTPNSGSTAGGTPVTIGGTNFLSTSSVTFGGLVGYQHCCRQCLNYHLCYTG